jgi:hypothetical protein
MREAALRHCGFAGKTQISTESYSAMSEAIAAVVFDLDGVLVDSESVWDAARREVVARSGGRWQADATRSDDGDEFTGVEPLPSRPTRRAARTRAMRILADSLAIDSRSGNSRLQYDAGLGP